MRGGRGGGHAPLPCRPADCRAGTEPWTRVGLGLTAYDVVTDLLDGDPASRSPILAEHGELSVNAMGLTDDEAEIVGRRLRESLTSKGAHRHAG